MTKIKNLQILFLILFVLPFFLDSQKLTDVANLKPNPNLVVNLDNKKLFLEVGQDLKNFQEIKQYILDKQINDLNIIINSIYQDNTVDTSTVNTNALNENNKLINILRLENLLFLFIGFVVGIIVGISGLLFLKEYVKHKKLQKQAKNQPTINTQIAKPEAEESYWNQEAYTSTQATQPTSFNNILKTLTIEPSTTEYSSPSASTPHSYISNSSNYPSSHSRVVEIYNTNSKLLSKNAIEVSETPGSINQRRLGVTQAVILERVAKGKGNYWVISEQGFSELVPKANLKINEFNYETVANIFNCHNYQQGYSTNFSLLETAKVVSINQDNWQLQQKGDLRF
ncbi:hypothetical protein [Calothrix sp. UHCC 0171]|uniref:hypothetical protein n=1 Tax=Calothrix sp. UHCC 0171 TaxID=3110245 RepID=UPI002B1FA409|nr:hypothetical protein [Calothrix sp. UHCC 0171]MEA5572379.1 hypothetical protein [Calothrix sp. UHCC 0171]